ncbi:phosphotransferase [Streptomyces luteireticuli]|uniref:phosphotransferase n=1 Tax=Streptomyces luteireticuli TaxID=173858 RepID=UPI0035569E04
MTTITTQPEDAARAGCHALGIDARGLMPLREHATSVYRLPNEDAVARVSPRAKSDAIVRGVALAGWLVDQGYPATEPLDVAQPFTHGPYVINFWRYYPQHNRDQPAPEHLGRLLRQLHDLPPPPMALPVYQPLASLCTAIGRSRLPAEIRSWLTEATRELLDAYSRLDFPLGTGLIHGDAYPGNLIWDGSSVRLGDWDEAALGPRELDLASTHHGAVRFGRPQQLINAFTRAYGYDASAWSGLSTLVAIRDFHTLGAFIKRADAGDLRAAAQLHHRIATLQDGNRNARWNTF